MIEKIIKNLKKRMLIKKIILRFRQKILLIRKLNVKNPQLYLEKYYYYETKEKLNLKNPQTLNDKINWYKLNYKNDLMITCSDKVKVHDYVKKCGLEHILVKRYGVYNNINEIDLTKLPEKFILKTNHDSGGNIVFFGHKNFKRKAKKIYRKSKKNYGYNLLEWPYLFIEKKLLIEELLLTKDNKLPIDYKVFCFNGEPKYVLVATNRVDELCVDFFDLNWNHLDCRIGNDKNSQICPQKPENLEEMLEYAKILSKPFPFVRVDFYNENGKVYFGELTFFHASGNVLYHPKEYNIILGKDFDINF